MGRVACEVWQGGSLLGTACLAGFDERAYLDPSSTAAQRAATPRAYQRPLWPAPAHHLVQGQRSHLGPGVRSSPIGRVTAKFARLGEWVYISFFKIHGKRLHTTALHRAGTMAATFFGDPLENPGLGGPTKYGLKEASHTPKSVAGPQPTPLAANRTAYGGHPAACHYTTCTFLIRICVG